MSVASVSASRVPSAHAAVRPAGQGFVERPLSGALGPAFAGQGAGRIPVPQGYGAGRPYLLPYGGAYPAGQAYITLPGGAGGYDVTVPYSPAAAQPGAPGVGRAAVSPPPAPPWYGFFTGFPVRVADTGSDVARILARYPCAQYLAMSSAQRAAAAAVAMGVSSLNPQYATSLEPLILQACAAQAAQAGASGVGQAESRLAALTRAQQHFAAPYYPAGQAMPAMPGAPGVGRAEGTEGIHQLVATLDQTVASRTAAQVLATYSCAQYLAMSAEQRVQAIVQAMGRLGYGQGYISDTDLFRSGAPVDRGFVRGLLAGTPIPVNTTPAALRGALVVPAPYDAYDRVIVARCQAFAAQQQLRGSQQRFAAPLYPAGQAMSPTRPSTATVVFAALALGAVGALAWANAGELHAAEARRDAARARRR